ncbi:hypothetical protein F4861DRAFT_540757 [Xylaria intraflava]|nr:hypothetical protein F4861DRAFT_540757 [Xylaria intraflava]
MQSTFLRAVDLKQKVYYHVERALDGQTFCVRLVRAMQGSSSHKCYYSTTVCFQRNGKKGGNVLEYHVSVPDIGGVAPDGISDEKLQQVMDANLSQSVPLLRINAKEEPFEWRSFDSPQGVEPTEFWQRSFVRSPTFGSRNLHLHQSALAWLSDTYTLGMALSVNPSKVGKQMRNVTMGATLTNNISIHEPMVKVDEWMLGERETSWSDNERAVIHQRFWDVKTGRLILSGTQEIVDLASDIRNVPPDTLKTPVLNMIESGNHGGTDSVEKDIWWNVFLLKSHDGALWSDIFVWFSHGAKLDKLVPFSKNVTRPPTRIVALGP